MLKKSKFNQRQGNKTNSEYMKLTLQAYYIVHRGLLSQEKRPQWHNLRLGGVLFLSGILELDRVSILKIGIYRYGNCH